MMTGDNDQGDGGNGDEDDGYIVKTVFFMTDADGNFAVVDEDSDEDPHPWDYGCEGSSPYRVRMQVRMQRPKAEVAVSGTIDLPAPEAPSASVVSATAD